MENPTPPVTPPPPVIPPGGPPTGPPVVPVPVPQPGTPIVVTFTEDFGPITQLKTFNMRNGDPADAKSLLIKPSIPQTWHWRPIENLAPENAVANVGAYIRSVKTSLSMNPPAGWSAGLVNKAAIVVGTARAVTTELYRIEAGDLIPGEAAIPHYISNQTPEGQTVITINPALEPNVQASLAAPLELTEADRAAIAAAHMSAIGILPVQGYSIVMTGHHYLSDPKTQSRRAFDAMERQHWTSTAVNQWWQADLDALRDALWHKACHPVVMSMKQSLASDEKIPKMLTAAGCGSAAARLPVIETEMRAANSYRVLLQTVRTLFESYGGSVDFVALDDAIAAVNAYPIVPPTGPSTATVTLAESVPAYVNNRQTALQYLAAVISGNQDTVGFCYGFYCALSDQTQTLSGGATSDTLKSSYSLSKLKNQSYASFVNGQQAFGDYTAAKAAARSRGEFLSPILKIRGGTSMSEGAPVASGAGVAVK